MQKRTTPFPLTRDPLNDEPQDLDLKILKELSSDEDYWDHLDHKERERVSQGDGP